MTRSEIRKYWPEWADDLTEDDWSELNNEETWLGGTSYSEEVSSRKMVTGQEYWKGSSNGEGAYALEASRPVTVTECWINVDRDGDGIAELKHVIIAGKQ